MFNEKKSTEILLKDFILVFKVKVPSLIFAINCARAIHDIPTDMVGEKVDLLDVRELQSDGGKKNV